MQHRPPSALGRCFFAVKINGELLLTVLLRLSWFPESLSFKVKPLWLILLRAACELIL